MLYEVITDLKGSGSPVVDQIFEQVFVVYNISENLVFSVQPVSTADSLEKAVVLH